MPGDMGHIAKKYRSDGSLLQTLGQPDGITRGELQRAAYNICRFLLDTPAFARLYQTENEEGSL